MFVFPQAVEVGYSSLLVTWGRLSCYEEAKARQLLPETPTNLSHWLTSSSRLLQVRVCALHVRMRTFGQFDSVDLCSWERTGDKDWSFDILAFGAFLPAACDWHTNFVVPHVLAICNLMFFPDVTGVNFALSEETSVSWMSPHMSCLVRDDILQPNLEQKLRVWRSPWETCRDPYVFLDKCEIYRSELFLYVNEVCSTSQETWFNLFTPSDESSQITHHLKLDFLFQTVEKESQILPKWNWWQTLSDFKHTSDSHLRMEFADVHFEKKKKKMFWSVSFTNCRCVAEFVKSVENLRGLHFLEHKDLVLLTCNFDNINYKDMESLGDSEGTTNPCLVFCEHLWMTF